MPRKPPLRRIRTACLGLLLLAGAWLLAPTAPRAVFGLLTWAYVLLGLRAEGAGL